MSKYAFVLFYFLILLSFIPIQKNQSNFMTSWLNQTRIVQQLAQNLLLPKKTRYQQDLIRYTSLKTNRLNYSNHTFLNKYQQKIQSTVFMPQNQANCCVVYLHGYGSHRLEALSILQAIPAQFGFCCFDFSGSGKSQGDISSYGVKESLDIASVLSMLKKKLGFKKFILWGRSMGAVASILYTSTEKDTDVLFQILDSPFSSFEQISVHHAKNIIKLPEMFINFGIKIMKQHLANNPFNPYTLNMCQSIKKCKTPTLFVYCQEDNVIPSINSRLIITNYPTNLLYEQILIQEDHNTYRSKETLVNIMQITKKYAMTQKIKEKIKHRKGFNQIISSTTPTARTTDAHIFKKYPGFIQCSLSKKKTRRTLKSQNEQKSINGSLGGIASFSSPLLKQ